MKQLILPGFGLGPEIFMLRVEGKIFHCELCGSNCFRLEDQSANLLIYRCQGCKTVYEGVRV